MRLHLNTLSGQSASLVINDSARISDLLDDVQNVIGTPSIHQRLVLGSSAIPRCTAGGWAATVSEAGLHDGDTVTVVQVDTAYLHPLPSSFRVTFTSSRERFAPVYSSAFTIEYSISGHASDGRMVIHKCRKNDTDRVEYDTNTQTVSGRWGHWMTGNHHYTRDMQGPNPLADFFSSWCRPYSVVTDTSKCFWKPGIIDNGLVVQGDVLDFPDDVSDPERPVYSAVPGWFQAPSEDCKEIVVDISMDGRDGPEQIRRMLVDGKGLPLRLAMFKPLTSRLHQNVEEYDVCVEELNAAENI